ncbi:apicomplexan specific protein [Cryptosporidium canis]|uniref:Apicomplexan specific protein n=1 Tax=Cryptosporidium canis TaxID=195482 RepID=A0A9D5DGD1_9CRYT|nr:apicomplexan specific protein [Cryptosporidium canis]
MDSTEISIKGETPNCYITAEEIKAQLKKILTNDNLDTLTPKKVREELERVFNLPSDSLKYRKDEINQLIDTIILEPQEASLNNMACKKNSTRSDINVESNTNHEELSDNFDYNNPNANLCGRSTKRRQVAMSIDEFLEKSQILSLTINGSNEKLAISPRQFSTGSVGWYYGGKVPLPVGDDLEVLCQVSVNCTVVGSKTWSQKQAKRSKIN